MENIVEVKSLALQRVNNFRSVRKRLTRSLPLVCFALFTTFGHAANPTFSPGGGTYSGPTQVTITCSGGASAFYTKDGSTPTIDSAHYKGPVTISSTATLKAICAVLSTAQYGIDDNSHESTNGTVGWKLADTAANDDPGGSGTPTSYVEAFDSTGNATLSLDGASLKLTQTSSQTVHQTNVLWPFIAGPLRHLHVLPYGHPGVSELQLQRSQRIGDRHLQL